jgi:DNA polymerase (family 10)
MGEKSEARILAGIAALDRMSGRHSLETAWKSAALWLDWLRNLPSVYQAQPAGSLRRWRESIGDLDLVVASDQPAQVMQAFTAHADVLEVKGQGEFKASVELKSGMRIQLWIQPPVRFGSLWQYATGSKNHNVRLRELAVRLGFSLSERGVQLPSGEFRECPSEENVYHLLGLAWIPPELREDRGEIDAALENRLPQLVEVSQRQAELHCHSTWSDGVLTIEQIALHAREKGIRLLAITDHSAGLGVAGGLSIERLRLQREEIRAVQQKMGDSIRLIQGAEVEIHSDGSLDYPDEVLAELDIAIASLHSSLRQPREVITQRLLGAINNPHIDLIGHPSGRLFPRREGADLDWDVILQAAQQSGVALEINASPYRLDLPDIYARRAAAMGIYISVNTDAHSQLDFDLAPYGISVARRAWLTRQQVINTWEPDQILAWLRSRGGASR